MWNPDPRCKHNTPIAQTQCKACMNDEIIELRSKLDRIRLFAEAQNMIALPGSPMDEGYRSAIEQLKELLE